MSAAETIRFSAPKAATQPWTPTDRDRLIFQWVKFDGHKQGWVATQLGMHQTTISRIVDRYERWIAHGGPSQQGGLSRDERLRAQRYLTYERNEWILNSALRIAGELENPIDTSTTNIKKTPQDFTKELEVRTQHAVLHRSGLAARFLRLAHRINMDQQKLVERDPLPDLEPLSHQDLAEDDDHLPAVCHGHPARADDEIWAGFPDPESSGCHGHPARADHSVRAGTHDPEPASTPVVVARPVLPMHKMHTPMQAELDVTDCSLDPYDQNHTAKKTTTPAYPVAPSPPESTVPANSNAFVALTESAPWP